MSGYARHASLSAPGSGASRRFRRRDAAGRRLGHEHPRRSCGRHRVRRSAAPALAPPRRRPVQFWAVAAGVPHGPAQEAGTDRPRGLLVRVAGRNVFRQTPEPASEPEVFVRTGHPDTMWISNLALGGLSNQWTGAVPRFSPSDFTEGERIDVRYRWPIGYDDLAP